MAGNGPHMGLQMHTTDLWKHDITRCLCCQLHHVLLKLNNTHTYLRLPIHLLRVVVLMTGCHLNWWPKKTPNHYWSIICFSTIYLYAQYVAEHSPFCPNCVKYAASVWALKRPVLWYGMYCILQHAEQNMDVRCGPFYRHLSSLHGACDWHSKLTFHRWNICWRYRYIMI